MLFLNTVCGPLLGIHEHDKAHTSQLHHQKCLGICL